MECSLWRVKADGEEMFSGGQVSRPALLLWLPPPTPRAHLDKKPAHIQIDLEWHMFHMSISECPQWTKREKKKMLTSRVDRRVNGKQTKRKWTQLHGRCVCSAEIRFWSMHRDRTSPNRIPHTET